MPQLWNNMCVVSKDELVPAYWTNIKSLQQQLYRYKNKPYGIKRAMLGGNGRELLINFDTLPREIQEALGDPRKLSHPMERFYEVDPKAVKFYSDFTYPDKSYIALSTQEQYIINSSVLLAALKLRAAREADRLNKGGSLKGVKRTICEDVESFNPILKSKFQVEHNLPSNYRRFWETVKTYTNDGYVALIKDAEGKRKTNAVKLTDEVTTFLNNLFAGQSIKPTPTEAARLYEGFLAGYVEVTNRATSEIYQPEQFQKISASSIRNYLAKWESKIATHAKRNGNRQVLQGLFTPPHKLVRPKFAGSLLSIDDRNPPFTYGNNKRVWFYMGLDVASGAFTCWVHGETKEALILNFYRQLVRNYHDWGFNLPFELECESSLNSSYKDTLLQPGSMFQKVRIEANNARGKIIERHFGEMRYRIEKGHEGWLPRPHAKSEPNQISQQKKLELPYDHIVNQSLTDIVQWNNTEHAEEKGISRWDYFCNHQDPNLPETNYKAILLHIGYARTTSCNAGIINFRNNHYVLAENGAIALGDNLIRLMKQVEGKTFEVKWLDTNKGDTLKAMVFLDNHYICEVLPQPKYNRATSERTGKDNDLRTIMSSYTNTVTAYQQQQSAQIDKVMIEDNRPKVINNNFSIEGINTYEPSNEPVEVLEEIKDDNQILNPSLTDAESWKRTFDY